MSHNLHDVCPLCHALIAYEIGKTTTCPYCENELLIGSSDPTGHYLSEIDPDIGGGAFGVFHLDLHPKGTHVCVICQRTYPTSFEQCPGLVDLALTSYQQKTKEHGPKTDERIASFLRENTRVVENTIQLRALESRYGDLDESEFSLMRKTIEALGLSHLIEDE